MADANNACSSLDSDSATIDSELRHRLQCGAMCSNEPALGSDNMGDAQNDAGVVTCKFTDHGESTTSKPLGTKATDDDLLASFSTKKHRHTPTTKVSRTHVTDTASSRTSAKPSKRRPIVSPDRDKYARRRLRRTSSRPPKWSLESLSWFLNYILQPMQALRDSLPTPKGGWLHRMIVLVIGRLVLLTMSCSSCDK